MSAQPITAELRRWIVAQATAGHPPDVVLDAMKASGWDEQVAIDAIETTMRAHLGVAGDGASIVLRRGERAGAAGARRRASLPPRRRSLPAIATCASSWR